MLNVELLETSHSTLRELPWITNDEYKVLLYRYVCMYTYFKSLMTFVRPIQCQNLDFHTDDHCILQNSKQCTLGLLVGVSPKVQLIHGKAG